jgi:hypothetical protein
MIVRSPQHVLTGWTQASGAPRASATLDDQLSWRRLIASPTRSIGRNSCYAGLAAPDELREGRHRARLARPTLSTTRGSWALQRCPAAHLEPYRPSAYGSAGAMFTSARREGDQCPPYPAPALRPAVARRRGTSDPRSSDDSQGRSRRSVAGQSATKVEGRSVPSRVESGRRNQPEWSVKSSAAPGERAEFGARVEVARAAASGYAGHVAGDRPPDWTSLAQLLFDALDGLLAAIDSAERASRPTQERAARAVQLRLPPCSACLGTGLSLGPADTIADPRRPGGD